MKKLLLSCVLLFACVASKAQTKDSLIKLYNKMVRIDNQWRKANYTALSQTGDNWHVDTPQEDSANVSIEEARIQAHDEYNAYWMLYHEKKGDIKQKLSPRYYSKTK